MSQQNAYFAEVKDAMRSCCSAAAHEGQGSCDPDGNSACCESAKGRNPMAACMEHCRYFFVVPLVLGIILLLLGYVLSPAVIVVLWMIGASLVLLMGVLGFVASRMMQDKYK